MPVLEVTQLRLKAPAVGDPAVLQSLSIVRGKLQTSSRFYQGVEDPTRIFILGLWDSLDAHLNFLTSPQRDEVLGPQEHLLDFVSTVHMNLDAMASLPLDASILAIELLLVKEDCVDAYNQAVTNHVRQIAESTKPYNVINGWRCDTAHKEREALIFSGWRSTEAHDAFAEAREQHARYPTIHNLYERSETWFVRDMEK